MGKRRTIQRPVTIAAKAGHQQVERSPLAIPSLYWTGANCWIIWNADAWIAGTNRR